VAAVELCVVAATLVKSGRSECERTTRLGSGIEVGLW
jgi:hypothetical protein